MSQPILDLMLLRTLVAGVDLGSFARAGAQLGRSPAAVSAQMKLLEQQVGQTLLRKSGRGLRPTAAGEALLTHARRLLRLSDEAMEAMQGAALAGEVRLGVAQDFSESWLPSLLGRFARLAPQASLSLRSDCSANLAARVRRGELDLALLWGDEGEKLLETPMRWIAGALAPPPGPRPLPLVLFEPPCRFRHAAVTALDAAAIAWRPACTSPALADLWAATRAGLGVTVRSALALPADLRPVPPEHGLPALPVIALSLLVGSATGPAADHMAALLRREIAERAISPA
jgi:DNA-binding transcriptional LysR family regulator